MNKRTETVKRILPTAVLISVILLMMALAFLPAVRMGKNSARVITANSSGSSDEAATALYKCSEYAEEHGFDTTLTGTIKANVFGIPYLLDVRGGRNVQGENFTDVKESVSAIVKVGLKSRGENGEYFVGRGEFDKKTDKFRYADEERISSDDFTARCGLPPVRLVKYITDGNIISSERLDENTYRFGLDIRAAEFAKNEIKTLLNSNPPEYKSIELTLITDGERAIKITAVEKFRAEKFGGIDCTATYTEVFSYN